MTCDAKTKCWREKRDDAWRAVYMARGTSTSGWRRRESSRESNHALSRMCHCLHRITRFLCDPPFPLLLWRCMHTCITCRMSVCRDVEHGELISTTTHADEIAEGEDEERDETRVPDGRIVLHIRATCNMQHAT